MFDKLIVSEPEGADFKNRRSYFMVSSIVVGALFLTAVVISIYSADIGLGNDQIELSTMLPPVAMAAEAPEPPKPREPAATAAKYELTYGVFLLDRVWFRAVHDITEYFDVDRSRSTIFGT